MALYDRDVIGELEIEIIFDPLFSTEGINSTMYNSQDLWKRNCPYWEVIPEGSPLLNL